MNYKIIQSNGAVNVIEVDGEVVQLSASIDIEEYLARKLEPKIESNDNINLDNIKPKASRVKRLHESADK